MIAVFLALFLLVFPPVAFSTTPQTEYQKVQEKMSEQQKKLAETRRQESSILSDIDSVNARIAKTESDLRKYRKSLKKTEDDIAALSAEIEATKGRLATEKDWLKRKLRMMNRLGYSGDVLTLLLSAQNVSQMMRIWKYLERVAAYERTVMTNYDSDLKRLGEESGRLQSLQAVLRQKTRKVQAQEETLAETRKSKETILLSVRSEKAAHQRMIRELSEASQRLLKIIRESSRKDTYTAAGFSKLRGRLPWPVAGTIAIPYGPQRDPQFHTPVFRNGIQIRTDANTDAHAIFAGKVIFAQWFKGFGQLVIVNHGSGYHSLYGNLSEIFSHVGDIIKQNQVIGKVGTSGMLNAPGLYFEIRYRGKPLDPAQWLRHK
jgi:septal ring factor EnvC (AmiA/AmiB activator)